MPKLQMMQAKEYILTLLLSAVFSGRVLASNDIYYDRFLELSATQNGFLSDTSLVQTNNQGPNLTNSPIAFSRFAENGELAGIKLGMNMSQVVEVWGKPHGLYTFCGLGPRFWYHPAKKNFGGITLAFKENRLAIIALDLAQMREVRFDNGLTGMTSELECEKTLGPPTLRSPRTRGWFFGGEVAYRTNEFRTDLHFGSVGDPLSTRAEKVLWIMSVGSKEAEHPVCVTSVANLLNYPNGYDGIRVEVSGYIKSGGELAALYRNHEDAIQSGDGKVWIAPIAKAGHEKDVKLIKEGNVRLVGVVDCALGSLELGVGLSNHWDVKISKLELLEEIKK